MQPSFYKFTDLKEFLNHSGKKKSEYKVDGIYYSVIGNNYFVQEGITYIDGFLVNTSKPVEGWEAFRIYPKTPNRVFA